jgi:hypothetical protein
MHGLCCPPMSFPSCSKRFANPHLGFCVRTFASNQSTQPPSSPPCVVCRSNTFIKKETTLSDEHLPDLFHTKHLACYKILNLARRQARFCSVLVQPCATVDAAVGEQDQIVLEQAALAVVGVAHAAGEGVELGGANGADAGGEGGGAGVALAEREEFWAWLDCCCLPREAWVLLLGPWQAGVLRAESPVERAMWRRGVIGRFRSLRWASTKVSASLCQRDSLYSVLYGSMLVSGP